MTHTPTPPDFTELYNLLRKLQSHLKLPRFRFHFNPTTHFDIFYVSETNTLRLHYRVHKGANIYIGHITPDGTLSPHSRKTKTEEYFHGPVQTFQYIDHLLDLLKQDPTKTILQHGQQTGICPLCDTPLLSPLDLATGMGPRCLNIFTQSYANADDL